MIRGRKKILLEMRIQELGCRIWRTRLVLLAFESAWATTLFSAGRMGIGSSCNRTIVSSNAQIFAQIQVRRVALRASILDRSQFKIGRQLLAITKKSR